MRVAHELHMPLEAVMDMQMNVFLDWLAYISLRDEERQKELKALRGRGSASRKPRKRGSRRGN